MTASTKPLVAGAGESPRAEREPLLDEASRRVHATRRRPQHAVRRGRGSAYGDHAPTRGGDTSIGESE